MLSVMSKPPLGRLKPVPLRDAWESESSEFTPWLAKEENIRLLSEALGLELEVEAQERNVGPFRADILCKNTGDESWVLIENQLEKTDHGHLGQLLTYAAGLDAVTIVWVAQRFTEEHRATLDWLNEITNDKFNFFGVEVQLFRIDDSPVVAPHFNVISKPNDWSKTVSEAAKRIESGDLTPTKQLQLTFWTQLREFAQQRGTVLRFQNPRAQSWTTLPIGRSGFWMDATMTPSTGEVSVQLVIHTASPKADFLQLLSQWASIEQEAHEQFEWREAPEKVQKRIVLRRSANPENEGTWPELLDWLVAKLELVHNVFGPKIKAMKLAESVEADPPA